VGIASSVIIIASYNGCEKFTNLFWNASLALEDGAHFRIGQVSIECVSGQQDREWSRPPIGKTCPFCGSTSVPLSQSEAVPCPDCEGLVLAVSLGPGVRDVVVLPAVYGAYSAERHAARGGMGIVLKGSNPVGEPVAIKVLLTGLPIEARDDGRFDREVAMLSRVRHPNVVKLLDHGRVGRIRFIIMEWVDGPSLRDVITSGRKDGRTEFAIAFRWFKQVCKGLAAIHAVGIVHRDIKPSNILIGPDGIARVVDLGIARRTDTTETARTMTGLESGTYEYMAPEQSISGAGVDCRADLYSLGVTFYELLASDRPVGAWRPASESNPSVPTRFDSVLDRLLARQASDRYDDVHDLLAAIAPRRKKSDHSDLAIPPPISTDEAGPGVRVCGERETILASRRRYNWLSMAFVLPGILLVVLGSFANPQLEEVAYLTIGGITSLTLAFAFAAMYRGLSPLLGAYFFLSYYLIPQPREGGSFGLIMIAIFMVAVLPDRYRARLAKLDDAPRAGDALPARKVRLPRYFWRSILPCLFYPWAPVSLWLSIQGYREREDRSKTAILSIIAMIWAGVCTLGCVAIVAIQFMGGFYGREGLNPVETGSFDASVSQLGGTRTDPTPAGAHLERGLASIRAGKSDEAIRELDEAIRLEPGLATAYNARATAFVLKKDSDRVISDAGMAIALMPSYAEPHLWRGVAYRNKGQVDPAIEDFTRAISLGPSNGLAYLYRGTAYLAKGEDHLAMADFGEAIRLVPHPR
jgi:tetratricopeptide (TPR) repeat protein